MSWFNFSHNNSSSTSTKSEVAQRVELTAENNRLENKVERLERKVEQLELEKQYIPVDIDDPAPQDNQEAREAYVAQVAKSYNDWLEHKLKHMISVSREILEDPERDNPSIDAAIKGGINTCWELIRYGKAMRSEQLSYETNEFSDSQ